MKLNKYYDDLKDSYLFHTVAVKTAEYAKTHPDKKIIRMGIGDVTLPIAPIVTEAMKKAADELSVKETFRGYEDSGAGYDFLRNAVSGYYKKLGADVSPDDTGAADGRIP